MEPSRMRRSLALTILSLVFAACGGGGADLPESEKAAGVDRPAAPTQEVPAGGAATTDSDAAETGAADAAPGTSARDTMTASASCTPDPPSSTTASWPRFDPESGGYSFAYPKDWEPVIPLRVTDAFDKASYAEAGVPADAPTVLEVVRDPAGVPNIGVYVLRGLHSNLDTLYARQEARLKALPQLKQILRQHLGGCVAGSPALGLEFLFLQDVVQLETLEQTSSGEVAFQKSWLVRRDGDFYHIQFVAPDSSDAGIMAEILPTWRWSTGGAETQVPSSAGSEADSEPAPTGGGVAGEEGRPKFAEAWLTGAIDPQASGPDPATATSTFLSDAKEIYVVYRLEEGAGGRVTSTWKKGVEVLLANDPGRDLPSDGTWAYEAITAPPGGFQAGSYEVVLNITDTGDSRTLPFTVEGAK
jgi:hypothetical protein